MKILPNQSQQKVEDLKFTIEVNGKEICDLIAFFGTFSGKPDLYIRKEICTKWYKELNETYKNNISDTDKDGEELNKSSSEVYSSMEDKSFGYG